MKDSGLVFRRVAFVSLVGPSVSVRGRFVVDSCEDLVKIGCLEGGRYGRNRKNAKFRPIFVVLGWFHLRYLLGTWEGVLVVVGVSIWLRFKDWW